MNSFYYYYCQFIFAIRDGIENLLSYGKARPVWLDPNLVDPNEKYLDDEYEL